MLASPSAAPTHQSSVQKCRAAVHHRARAYPSHFSPLWRGRRVPPAAAVPRRAVARRRGDPPTLGARSGLSPPAAPSRVAISRRPSPRQGRRVARRPINRPSEESGPVLRQQPLTFAAPPSSATRRASCYDCPTAAAAARPCQARRWEPAAPAAPAAACPASYRIARHRPAAAPRAPRAPRRGDSAACSPAAAPSLRLRLPAVARCPAAKAPAYRRAR